MITLVASGVRTVSGNSGILAVPPHPESMLAAKFILDVTAAATVAGDTLNVYIQSSPDASAPWWNDTVSFTQVLGNGGAKRFEAIWTKLIAPTTPIAAPPDGALAAGSLAQGDIIGPALRVKWVLAGTGSF